MKIQRPVVTRPVKPAKPLISGGGINEDKVRVSGGARRQQPIQPVEIPVRARRGSN